MYYRNAANPGAAAYLNSLDGDGRLHRVERYEVQSLDPISGFLLIDTRSALEPIHEFLAGRFPDQLNLYFAEDLSQRGYHWLQAFHRQADKGRMLETLTQTLPWPRDRVAVFGDNWNDMEMFQAAGKAIAVSNAVSPLRDRAQEVIGSHAEGAVVNYLETLWA
ncbi:MAG: HAD hydrolase family protein, partial [Nitrospinaceae bacterium]|nr:HAD hydrolase family protein [Nitrospinaceae bacterium]NIR57951.1 HAD hydrolase family protein [Nitrospinaceae bacterium]NIS88416.1 HAD hydrolase family protein [Nitrospinaceae bacterium]NIT85289.1 HAD hydrolase family protein [Nitrospinaceae bacterium]NIU47447.1 HAD hydrolase family protein [Nitrospinaceae bacterium]